MGHHGHGFDYAEKDMREFFHNHHLAPLAIGQPAPRFEAEAVLPASAGNGAERFGKVSLDDNIKAGKWTILYFYPRDFTFVCPTEIRRFNQLYPQFQEKNAEVIACSTDSTYVHLKWQETDLGLLDHPHMADVTHHISKVYNVYDRAAGLALRGTFIIDPQGNLQQYSINGAGVGRSVEEVLRLLEACQNAAEGKLMPCEWKPGDSTL